MHRLNLIVPDGPKRRAEDISDWKQTAPRWFLLLIIASALVLLGFLFSRVESGRFRDQQRLEAALIDAPTKYQARLSERVAVIEAQTQALSTAVKDLTAEVKANNQAQVEQTVQLKLLTAELKARR